MTDRTAADVWRAAERRVVRRALGIAGRLVLVLFAVGGFVALACYLGPHDEHVALTACDADLQRAERAEARVAELAALNDRALDDAEAAIRQRDTLARAFVRHFRDAHPPRETDPFMPGGSGRPESW